MVVSMEFVGGFHVSRFPPTQSVRRIDDAGVLAQVAALDPENASALDTANDAMETLATKLVARGKKTARRNQ